MKKILVVDDDPLVSEFAATLLGEAYQVEQAEDGQQGFDKALSLKPDIVVTDLMMPGMHGYELCSRLKQSLAGVRVLVASSKSFPVDMQAAREAGADAYIVKPFAAKDLLEKVASLADGPAVVATAAASARPRQTSAPSPFTEEGAPAGVAVRFWGTRGSCAAAGSRTSRYGGNTACTEVRVGGIPVILDCGTGIRELGLSLMREFKGRPIHGHLFVGHTHWDHIQGFPFFTPLYDPKNSFRVHSVRGAHGSLERVFSGSMASDYFPIPLSSLSCDLKFIEMQGPVELPGGVRVRFHHLNHPGVAIGFRIEAYGKVVTYLSDHENFAKLNGDNDVSRRQDAEIAAFAQGSDLLISEAQYTEEEYPRRRGWGHSTYDDAVRCALAAGAKRLAIFHHDPERTDDQLDVLIERCRGLVREAGSPLACFGAQEGQTLEL